MKLVTGASKPKRISKNVARLLKIKLSTKAAGANWFPAEQATVNKSHECDRCRPPLAQQGPEKDQDERAPQARRLAQPSRRSIYQQ